MVTKEQLIQFEEKIEDLFNKKHIKAPIHLYHGNEDQMLKIFENIDVKNDWVFCTWRNHYQALCKDIPSELIESEIIKGKSMVMNLPEYKFLCSSIVGGITPIAAGTALALKLKNSNSKVWCFLGDMSAETGAFHESYKYSLNFDLPITWVIEDNKKSVLTPTETKNIPHFSIDNFLKNKDKKIIHIGGWLRNIFSFYNLEIPITNSFKKFHCFNNHETYQMRKVAIKGKNMNNYYRVLAHHIDDKNWEYLSYHNITTLSKWGDVPKFYNTLNKAVGENTYADFDIFIMKSCASESISIFSFLNSPSTKST